MPRSTTVRWLLRLLGAVVLAVFAYQFVRVGKQLDWPAFLRALGRPGNWRFLAVAVAFMPLNWWLEARKWNALLQPFAAWPFGRVLRATLAGVSVSAATPNRIGEIGGRMLLARRGEWSAVIASTLLGGLCQWVAFLGIAWPALVLTVYALPGVAPAWLSPYWLLPVGPLLILLAVVGGKPFLVGLLDWGGRRFRRDVSELRGPLSRIRFSRMLVASGYACARFVVYCTQLYLLLWFFGVELPVVTGLAGIAAIYLVQAGIPLPPGLNFVTRTELGLLLWGTGGPDAAVGVLAAYTALFSVNVLLPSLPGYWLIVRKNNTP
ncbi:lysylphosphatidylglycerol synthase transmembrane domain-containing protein [Lewinella sp. JB7]|uniref:lysylphosphatidylglycerol synthase transmembrane domain-containing protein n=1 Tax=Lewinella sp. JB7 TaxID=2962887 RepID=UPI0020CA01C5|nr:lysylphosphatidylglycerol synthase domain-containing protein [Lewinella sp. JB7]MCP9237372.1 flippase-like domain-containing protein [Lewinella sp. JB7]